MRDRLGEREAVLADLVEAGKRDGSIAADVDTASFARFCITLALGAMAARSLALEPPDRGEWHALIARLLDACAPEGNSR